MSRIPKTYIGFSKGKGIVIELIMDFLCPFSKKAFKTLTQLDESKIELRIIPYLQPWHPQAYYVLSSAIAVQQIAGSSDTFWKFAHLLFAHIDDFSDEKVFQKTPKEIYEQLEKLAEEVGIQKNEFEKRVNSEQTVLDIKILQKYGRQNSVHVTPTFLVNGLMTDEVSSSSTVDQWNKLIEKLT